MSSNKEYNQAKSVHSSGIILKLKSKSTKIKEIYKFSLMERNNQDVMSRFIQMALKDPNSTEMDILILQEHLNMLSMI